MIANTAMRSVFCIILIWFLSIGRALPEDIIQVLPLRLAEGTTMGIYICGFGGVSQEALRSNAVAEMYNNAKLKGSQTIINVNITTSVKTIAGVYTQKYVTARGQIIEFR